ncbi:MAG: hypothetical protein ACYDDI_16685 [Candidatus Acidiferrales bacterium]
MIHLQRFGGGGETFVSPLVLVAMALVMVLIFILRKENVIIPLLAGFFLIPMDQVLVLGPFHFQMLRVLILFGWGRLLATRLSSKTEILSGGMNAIDKAMLLSTGICAVDFVLLYRESGAFINQLGVLYTVFGIYFLMRFLIRNEEDVHRTIKTLAYISAVIAVIMLIEQATGRSPYVFLGSHGVIGLERQGLMVRDGRFRALASFQHPILAGTFGAILLPMFFGLFCKGKNRRVALMGMIASTLIVACSVSSTPLIAYAAGIGALCLWPLRKQMRAIRWGIVLVLVSLQVVMKANVWALIARAGVIGGSSSDHRYELVNNFILRFGDWWLLGVKSTASWGWDMFDRANQYVTLGETYGLLPLIFFIAVIVYGFKYVGIAREASEDDKKQEKFFWALGAAMFANAVAYFGISYFDQTMVVWYAFLAIIWATTAPFVRKPQLLTVDGHSLDSRPAQVFPSARAVHRREPLYMRGSDSKQWADKAIRNRTWLP